MCYRTSMAQTPEKQEAGTSILSELPKQLQRTMKGGLFARQLDGNSVLEEFLTIASPVIDDASEIETLVKTRALTRATQSEYLVASPELEPAAAKVHRLAAQLAQ